MWLNIHFRYIYLWIIDFVVWILIYFLIYFLIHLECQSWTLGNILVKHDSWFIIFKDFVRWSHSTVNMSQTKIALDALDYAVTQFKQHKTLLQMAFSSKSKNERNIRNKMTSLSDALENINKSHTLWVSKAGLSEEDLLTEMEKYNTTWL